MSYKSGLSLLLSLLITMMCHAQSNPESDLKKIEQSFIERDQRSFYGKQYDFQWKGQGNPFFQDELLFLGDLIYKGTTFHDVYFLYDILKHHLVVMINAGGGNKRYVLLNPYEVDGFVLGTGRAFESIHGRQSDQFGLSDGYYESIHTGRYQVWAKYEKKEEIRSGILTYQSDRTLWLTGKKENPVEISRKRRFLKLFPNERQDIKAYLKQRRLKYKLLNHSGLRELLLFVETQVERDNE